MIQRKLRSKLLHDGKSKFILTAVLVTVTILPGIGSSLTLHLPEIHIVKGRTAAGHPYMNGGFNYDEQRAMEQAAQPFNLKLLFANSVFGQTTEAPSKKYRCMGLGFTFSFRRGVTRSWHASRVTRC